MENDAEPPDDVNLLLSQSLLTSNIDFLNHHRHYEKYLNKVNLKTVSNIEECCQIWN